MNSQAALFYGYFYDGGNDASIRADFLEKYLASSSGTDSADRSVVIDVGAGVGDLAFRLAERGHQVLCFEKSTPVCAVLLDRFRERKELKSLVSIFPTDFTEFPLVTHADLLIASNVFSHLDLSTKQTLLKKAHEQLKVGGKIIFNCVQYTPLRPEQPFSEIHKKVYGENVLRHFASSKSKIDGNLGADQSHPQQEIEFEYRMEFRGKLIASFRERQLLTLDTPGEIRERLQALGFQKVEILEGWSGMPYDSKTSAALPGFVVVAEKGVHA